MSTASRLARGTRPTADEPAP
ncbi:MAG: hypothetical protein JWN08_3086, partial [Frankiales bacterium]|nr:hypothetical protein [Frankiales bacterium]